MTVHAPMDRPLESDPLLIARVRAGSSAAYAELFARHHAAALGFARRLAGPSHADDLVAEAFARVLDALQRDLGPTVSFRAYLLTAVRSAWANTARAESRYDLVPDHEAGDATPAELIATDDADARFDDGAIAAAFRSLPERWQAVLWYDAVEDLPHAQIAELLGIKPNAVAALGFRAREGLRSAYLAQHLATTEDPVCRVMLPLLPAYARGQLDKRKRPRLEEHLVTCERCTAALLDLEDVNRRLGALLMPAVLGLAAARAGWPEHEASDDPGTARRPRRSWRQLSLATRAAVLAVLAAAAFAAPLAGRLWQGTPVADALRGAVDDTALPRLPGHLNTAGRHGAPGALDGTRPYGGPRPPAATEGVLPTGAVGSGRTTGVPATSGQPASQPGSHPGSGGPAGSSSPPPVGRDLAITSATVTRFGALAQNAERLAITLARPTTRTVLKVVITHLVGSPVKLGGAWTCPAAARTLPTSGPTATATLTCTYTGPTTATTTLTLGTLTSGASTATLTATPPASAPDPHRANNRRTVTLAG